MSKEFLETMLANKECKELRLDDSTIIFYSHGYVAVSFINFVEIESDEEYEKNNF